MNYIFCLLLSCTIPLFGKINILGKNVCKNTSLELIGRNSEKIYLIADKLSITSHLCKMKNLLINFPGGCFKAEYGELDSNTLSGYVSKHVSFESRLIRSNFEKIFINLQEKHFHTDDKVVSKIHDIYVYSEGIIYDKTKSQITFLKNVRVKIN